MRITQLKIQTAYLLSSQNTMCQPNRAMNIFR